MIEIRSSGMYGARMKSRSAISTLQICRPGARKGDRQICPGGSVGGCLHPPADPVQSLTGQDQALLRYSPLRVSILMTSPMLMNRGTISS